MGDAYEGTDSERGMGMRFSDIPQFLTNRANYHVDVGFKYFSKTIRDYIDELGLILNPDFQRGHVWTEEQQEKYIEYVLRGGTSGKEIYFNKPSWHCKAKTDYDDFVCVDGLQRITAIMKFQSNEIKAFGLYYNEFDGEPREITTRLSIYINDLQYEKNVLQWYIEMNEGGTPHTKEEIQRVKDLLSEFEERSAKEILCKSK